MSIREKILDILYPPKCAFCGALTGDSGGVCAACERALPLRPPGHTLEKAGQFDCAVALYYDGPVRAGIHALKFEGASARSRVFARYLAQTAAEELGGQFDAITFVPVSARRRFARTYDQAQLLAEECARIWQVKCEKTLRKVRNNPPQSTVRSPAERRANVLGAYRVRSGADVAGRRFLLIDDVVTTGSTLEACAQELLLAGASQVVCAALAGNHRGREKFGKNL